MKQPDIQDSFLAQARRGRMNVVVFLMNGFQMRGVITDFDHFTVVLTADGKQNLIYKHAISTISPARAVDLAPREPLTPAREIPA